MPTCAPRPIPRCSVAIVDDHTALVEMLQPFIDGLPNCRCVGWAVDRAAALELIRREKPDLLVLDLQLPAGSGLELLEAVQEVAPKIRAIVFSGYLRSAVVQRALEAGVFGLVTKGSSLEELREAILAARAGRAYLSRDVSAALRELVIAQSNAVAEGDPLSEREIVILREIAEGFRSKEIAERLGVSIHTIVNHRSRLMRKTGLRGVAQLSRYATQIGLVTADVLPGLPQRAAMASETVAQARSTDAGSCAVDRKDDSKALGGKKTPAARQARKKRP